MKNIDQFNEAVGQVFAKLYEEFPIKVDLDISEFTDEDVSKYEEDMDGVPLCTLGGHAKLVDSSIRWLSEEGYISMEDSHDWYRPTIFKNCRLTNKGFVALGALPKGLQSSETLGDQLVGFAKESAVQQSKDGVGALVKMALSLGRDYIITQQA